jgi:uncharacterized protein
MNRDLKNKIEAALELIRPLGAAAVAYSGGVDSVLTAILASRALGERAKIITFTMDFTSARSTALAVEHAKAAGLKVQAFPLNLLQDPRIAANPANRCYFCKKRVFFSIPDPVVLDGTNADDDPSRPGLAAAEERGVISPLLLSGITKAEVRQALREFGHPAADVPSDSCLATRIAPGVRLTPERLRAAEAAEDQLRSFGYEDVRVAISSKGLSLKRPARQALTKDDLACLQSLARELGISLTDC